MPTVSVENYLKAIYHLEQQRHALVKNKEIAERLEISLPSVTSMLKALADEGLVEYQRYKGVSLTATGRRQALNVIRKHRLIELFLVQTLDYTWDEVHAEAEQLEHAISDELAARIERALAYPSVDPHGDPIPSADGTIHRSEATPLAALQAGQGCCVERVLDQSPELLRYLKEVGVMPGAELTIEHVLSVDGQLTIALHAEHDAQKRLTLTRQTASRILVSPVTPVGEPPQA